MKDIRWWKDPSDYTLVAGVFEGGGAKGISYLGAMCAMKKKELWFNAVAGASAGAMTALAIAAAGQVS